MSSRTTDIEKQNLEAHVELCAQRYQSLEIRLDSITDKVLDLQKLIESSHHSMTRVLIGAAGTIVTGIVTVVVALLSK